MTLRDKNERYEVLRLAKRARGGLYVAERQALLFVAEAQTMQEGVCRKALTRAEDQAYQIRNIQWGLHGKRRNGKREFPGLIARGVVIASGNLKGGRAPGGHGLPATYAIDVNILVTFVPDIDDPDPKSNSETPENGETNPETLGETKGETLGVTQPEKGETKGDLIHTRSCSSSYTPSAATGTASDPSGESSPAREPARSEIKNQNLGGDGTAEIEIENAGTAPRPGTEPAVQTPFPPPQENQKHGQSNSNPSDEDRHEALISSVRLRQLDRGLTDVEIYRKYKDVFDRVVREAGAYDRARCAALSEARAAGHRAFLTPEQEAALNAMPRGKDFERPLAGTKKQIAAAADFYRIVGGVTTLAKWEDFLVNTDHTKSVGKPVLDDGGEPTGQFYSESEEAKWLLYDFVKEQGGVPQPAPVIDSSKSDETRAVDLLVMAGAERDKAIEICKRFGAQNVLNYLREQEAAERKS